MGPVPMALGPFAFEGLGFGFTGEKRTLDTAWAKIEVAQDFDRLQFTGPRTDEVTISGVIFDESFGGQASLDGLREAATAGSPLMLVQGGADLGRVFGLVVIQSIDEDRSFHDAAGRPRRNAYSIKVLRYPGKMSGAGIVGALLSLLG